MCCLLFVDSALVGVCQVLCVGLSFLVAVCYALSLVCSSLSLSVDCRLAYGVCCVLCYLLFAV